MLELDTTLLTLANEHYQAGRLPDADRVYRQVLKQNPRSQPALSWLALIADQQGRLADSIAFYEQLLAVNPESAEVHSNFGAVLCRAGRVPEAIAQQQQALALKPDSADSHYNLGVVLFEAGQLEAAIEHYRRAIALRPGYANAHNNLGIALSGLGKVDEAIPHYLQAVALEPNHANAHNNLAVAFSNRGQIDDAIAHYQQALAANPNYVSAHNNLGTLFQQRGNFDEAEKCYRRAIALKPDYASAYDNLGTVLQEKGNVDAAIEHYQRAIALKPDAANAYNNLGSALKEKGRYEAAIASCQQAIRLDPDHADAHSNYGSVLVDRGDCQEAIAHFEHAIRIRPQHANAHLNLGIVLLMLGDFPRGFPEYHWRWQTRQCPDLRYPQALWDGANFAGKTVLLTAEQGFGDNIQFARYAPLVAQRGGTVVLACPRPLVRLMQSLPGIERCVDRDRVNVQTHFHVPLLDLPMILGTTVDTIPAEVPYLQAVPEAVPIPASDSFKVGIVWASNPANSTSSRRSCGLSHFLSLLQIPNLTLYSLQKEPSEADAAVLAAHPNIHDLRHQIQDFADTAAAIAQLDLVISVDTAVAHLAGALGKPVWTLLPKVPDWRWMLDRTDTPWYPTMRLFRQATAGDWDTVFLDVITALNAELGQARPLERYQTRLPETPETYLQRGFACYRQGQFEAAIGHYQRALSQRPNFPEAENNWGAALCQLGRLAEAIEHYDTAIRLNPTYAEAHLNLGIARLLLGDLRQGFAEYYWRWHTGTCSLAYPQALWDGSDLGGKTILLTAEQGFGDNLQFIRYVPLVAQRNARVIVACQKPLIRLFANLPGVERCIDRDTEAVQTHVHVPLLELPRILGTTLETVPAEVPYLGQPELARRTAINGDATPNRAGSLTVGIVWATHSTSSTAVQRSCGLNDFLPLFDMPGVTIVSLQKDLAPVETAWLKQKGIENLGEGFTDFADTAAAIARLDLLISIDTSVAHLAGAMGKPVWTLLPRVPDWRWLLDRSDSPWYPTMRLFRQTQAGEWTPVLEQVIEALKQQVGTLVEPIASDAIRLPATSPYRLQSGPQGTFLIDPATASDEPLESEVQLARSLIHSGDVVIEVGAQIGMHTALLSQAVGADGKVWAIEADQSRFQLLCANLALNHVTNTVAYPFTLEASITTPYGVAVSPLQTTIDQFFLVRCNGLKLNAATNALVILKGAEQTLRRCQPIVWLAGHELGLDVIRYLEMQGYEIYRHSEVNLFGIPVGRQMAVPEFQRVTANL